MDSIPDPRQASDPTPDPPQPSNRNLGAALPRLPEAHDPAPWGLHGAFLVTFMSLGAQVLLAAALGLFARWVILTLEPNIGSHPEEVEQMVIQATIVPLVLLYALVTVGLIYVSISLIHRRPFLESLGLRPAPLSRVGRYALMGCVMASVSLAGTFLFPPEHPEEVGGALRRLAESGPLGHTLWLGMAILVAPTVEELLFRGYAYLGARRRLGALWAGVCVTVVFVSLHMAETGLYLPALLGIAATATVLVIVMERTGNLIFCIACHLGYNGTLATLTFIAIDAPR